MDPYFFDLLSELQRSGFQDLAGAHVSARVPVSRALMNRVVAHSLAGSSAPVKDVDIRPRDDDRFDVVITLAWRLVPPLTVAFAVERQPQFPVSPVLVLRWSLLGGLGAIASRFIASLDRLPAGVRLQDDRLVLDIPALVAGGPGVELLPYIKTLELHTVADRVVIDVELAVGERRSPNADTHPE